MEKELPPHARRILLSSWITSDIYGTTSACAENTRHTSSRCRLRWNYLRMRGEYALWRPPPHHLRELPPHARRILFDPSGTPGRGGTTSACAENTIFAMGHHGDPRNYLRMRGEYILSPLITVFWGELPPHARRILHHMGRRPQSRGTTSACAENTICELFTSSGIGNYLRMRGEY